MKRIYFFRVFQALLVFSLAFTLTNCGNLDNPLEELSGGGGSGGSSTINATAITLDQTLKVIKLGGDALTIKVNFTPSDATDKSVTWESSDPTIATVENGVVTPKALGIATITAKSGDLTATCEVFVGKVVDLSTKGANYTVNDYDILSGNIGDYYININMIDGGYHVAFDGITTTKGISCTGDATIYLIDGKTNTVSSTENNKPGIWIGISDKTFTINAETEGTGILNATGGNNGAGIGNDGPTSGSNESGNITINGGKITANGGAGAAGIGTGKAENGNNKCGAITINGGTVTASGGLGAAGIGTGYSKDNSNTCGVITINGGTVNATGVAGGAGIGTGYAYAPSGDATAECGNIIIAGGTVNATGGAGGAGIGTGVTNAVNPAKTASQTCGAITIGTGVTSVTATKGSSAPNSIGVGYMNNSGGTENQACGTITIGGVEYWDGTAYQNGGNTYLIGNITYPEP